MAAMMETADAAFDTRLERAAGELTAKLAGTLGETRELSETAKKAALKSLEYSEDHRAAMAAMMETADAAFDTRLERAAGELTAKLAGTLGEIRELSETAKKAALKSLDYANESRTIKRTAEITAGETRELSETAKEAALKSLEYADEGRAVKEAVEITAEAIEVTAGEIADCAARAEAGIKAAAGLLGEARELRESTVEIIEKQRGAASEFRAKVEDYRREIEEELHRPKEEAEAVSNSGGRRPRIREDRRR
jgi:chromosome segregation ATPase